MSEEFDMSQFTEEFIKEASDTVEHLDKELLLLEKNPKDIELLNAIFRDVHTIKGSAAFLDFKYIKELSHKTESLLDKLRNSEMVVSGKIMDLLFKSVDLLKKMVNNIIDKQTDKMDIVDIVQELLNVVQGKDERKTSEVIAEKKNISAERIEKNTKQDVKKKDEFYEKKEQSYEELIEKENIIEKTGKQEGIDNVEKVEENKLPDTIEKIITEKREDVQIKGINSIRVDTKRVDIIMNLVSELVTGRNRLLQIGQQFKSEELNETSVFIGRITTEIQAAVMKIRMVPLEKTFSRFSRIVRDLSKQLNKDVELTIKGQDTELDKIVSEEIYEPILHMIRNALDHGIETAEERRYAGKNPIGRITISARQEENFVYIEISDDGKGINAEVIKNKGIERGLFSIEAAEKMNEYDIINVIFKPGFSTSEVVTDVSGRGVGMDVVKTSIEKIGGIIDIMTEYGKGSTFRIRLPLTLAIMQVLIIGVGEKKYAIPLNSVIESIRIEKKEIETISGREVIFLRGKPLPIVYLSSVFDISENEKENDKLNIVVLGFGEKRAGLVIDDMFGKLEIVIKPLGNYLGKIKGVSGAAILGDGSIIMILDSGLIVREGKTLLRNKNDEKQENIPRYFEKAKHKNISILYVEDSKSLQKMVKRSLESNGLKLETADDGASGLRKVETTKYDMIITDYEMPNMDGYEFLTKIRNMKSYKYTPVIVLSARDYEDNKDRWEELNIAEYLNKPFDVDTMLKAIGRIIERI